MDENLIVKINYEISQIDKLFDKSQLLIEKSLLQTPDYVKLTALGSILHSYYNGIESIFLIISKNIDRQTLDSERTNGNGSLMRIAPLALYTRDMEIGQRYELCREVSSITHRHTVSVTACFILIELLRNITLGQDKPIAYRNVINETIPYLNKITDNETMAKFDRLPNITALSKNELKSGGYVIETIEASMWCFMNTQCYADAVLSAVNLGHDTDTTAAVTGAIAGLYYGTDGIPSEWIRDLKNKELIEAVAKKWDDK